jgi:hypothetical protein
MGASSSRKAALTAMPATPYPSWWTSPPCTTSRTLILASAA